MSPSNHSQGPLDPFIHPSTAGNTSNPLPGTITETQPHPHNKHSCEDSDSENSDNCEADLDAMDIQHAKNITTTQAIGDTDANAALGVSQLPPPLSAEHATVRSDFEIVTMTAMERLYSRITADIEKSATDATKAFQKTTDQLHNQITALGARVTHLQQQILAYQRLVWPIETAPAVVLVIKVLKTKLMKKNTVEDTTRNPAAAANISPPVPSTIPQTIPTNTHRWETVPSGANKMKATTPKLITTK